MAQCKRSNRNASVVLWQHQSSGPTGCWRSRATLKSGRGAQPTRSGRDSHLFRWVNSLQKPSNSHFKTLDTHRIRLHSQVMIIRRLLRWTHVSIYGVTIQMSKSRIGLTKRIQAHRDDSIKMNKTFSMCNVANKAHTS